MAVGSASRRSRRVVGARRLVDEPTVHYVLRQTAAVLHGSAPGADTPMVVVWVNLRAQAHKRAEIISAVDELIERMRRTPGCNRGHLYVDSQDPHALSLLSEWQSADDADAFLNSKGFQAFRGIRILLRGEPLIILDEVQARMTRLFR
jgi:quinol monooxygenase YgiN